MSKNEIDAKELKKIEIDILLAVHDFCEAHHLKYCLWGGTLLGAIRHDGFIPWDDDVDIAMPREDFEVFVKTFDSDEYGVSCCKTDCRHPYWHAKAYHKGTCKVEPIYYKKDFSIGIDVDVFPLDSYDDFEEVMKTADWRLKQKRKYGVSLIPRKCKTLKLALIGFVYRTVFRWDANNSACAVNEKSQSFGKNGSGFMLYADSNINKPLRLEKSWFENRILHVFEGHMVYIPEGYDALLRACYGDYMTPPPNDKRVTHHSFKVYYR